MAKRANGEGWINKNEDGSWTAGGMVSLPDGSKKRIKFQAQTQKEALKKFREAKAKYEAGLLVARQPLLTDYLAAWIATDYQHKAPSTMLRARQYARSITDIVGDVRIDRLTSAMLRQWIAQASERYAPMTVQQQRIMLNRALEDAVADRLIERNPLDRRIRGPKVKQSAGRALSLDEVRNLLGAARGNWYEVAVYLGVFLGLRRGEIAGLRWTDIDEAQRSVTIAGQITYTPRFGLAWSEPKAESGRRVPLSDSVLRRLQFHRLRQQAERLACGWPPAVHVFQINNDNLPHPTNISYAFNQIRKAAGVSVRLHDLRHTAATLMQQAGASVSEVGAALGHKRLSTTLDVYTHVTHDDAARAINALSALLERSA